MQTTNTSTKQTHFNHSHPVRFENETNIITTTTTIAPAVLSTTATKMTTHLSSFSTSEPHLGEDFVHHDINCAKNKNAYSNQTHNG